MENLLKKVLKPKRKRLNRAVLVSKWNEPEEVLIKKAHAGNTGLNLICNNKNNRHGQR